MLKDMHWQQENILLDAAVFDSVEYPEPVHVQWSAAVDVAAAGLARFRYDRPCLHRHCLHYNCLFPFEDKGAGVLYSLC